MLTLAPPLIQTTGYEHREHSKPHTSIDLERAEAHQKRDGELHVIWERGGPH